MIDVCLVELQARYHVEDMRGLPLELGHGFLSQTALDAKGETAGDPDEPRQDRQECADQHPLARPLVYGSPGTNGRLTTTVATTTAKVAWMTGNRLRFKCSSAAFHASTRPPLTQPRSITTTTSGD
jgi:hypothetical protein